VSAHPSPTVRKVVNSNETLRVDHHASPITIRQGDILFAFNTFGDDVFACPISVATTTKLPTTTMPATTVPTTTTTTAAITTTTNVDFRQLRPHLRSRQVVNLLQEVRRI